MSSLPNIILATLGLNPLPSETPVLTTNPTTNNIACYGAFQVNFVPPFTQFGLSNASITASSSLQKIPAEELYNGTLFGNTIGTGNQIVMAPIRVSAKFEQDELILIFEFPKTADVSGYVPFDALTLMENASTKTLSSGQASGYYQLGPQDNFWFPGINTTKKNDNPPSFSLEAFNLIQNFDILFKFYRADITTKDASGNIIPPSYSFQEVSLTEISSANADTIQHIAVAFMALLTKTIGDTDSIDFFIQDPSVLNQSTIPETDFATFVNLIYTTLSPSTGNTPRLLGIIYFDQFTLLNGQSVPCVLGQNIFSPTASNPPASASCPPATCK